MEYIIIIFFIIFILYNYLYEYYDECKIKNCNSNYYLNNNNCIKCNGVVSIDGKTCECNYPNDENIIKNAVIDYYNNKSIFKGLYMINP